MMSPTLCAEIRSLVHQELAKIEDEVRHAGTYTYLCSVGGMTIFSHHPVGAVLRTITH